MLIALAVSLLSSVVQVSADPNGNVDRHVSTSVETREDGSHGLSDEDKRGICAAYEANLHAVHVIDGDYRAHNPGQRWQTSFDGRGFTTVPDVGGWTWGLELERFGFAGALQDLALPRGVRAEGQRVAYDWSAALEEWYVNDARGLEHGYTVRERPAGGAGQLTLSLGIRGELVPRVQSDGRGVRFVDDAGIVVVTYAGLVVFDATGQQLDARFDEVTGGLELRVDERDACYPLTIDPIAQQQAYLKPAVTNAPFFALAFGWGAAISGDTVAVGCSSDIYVFVRSGSTWSQQAIITAAGGPAIALSGDTIVTPTGGVPDSRVKVFVRSGTTWSQQAILVASNAENQDLFGQGTSQQGSVAISGDTIVVGARAEDSNATGVNGDQNDNSTQNAGAAYVFVRSGTTWSQQAYLKASNPNALDDFGDSVAISGDTVVVCAQGEDSNAAGVNGNQGDNSASASGAAYVFVRSGTTWSQQAYLKASNSETNDLFGHDVSVSGNTIVVAAMEEDSPAAGVNGSQGNGLALSGAAYVFVRDGTTWSQQAYLKASNPGQLDSFGSSVSVSGDVIAVAAPLEDSGAAGVNGDQSDNSRTNTGAVYVFQRSATLWSQQAYLKTSNPDDFDGGALGPAHSFPVEVSGDTVLLGVPADDSIATGVNGDASDNSAVNNGAAFVFELDMPTHQAYCFGDGSLATPCPCSLPNTVPSPPAAPGHGCANSLNLAGALLGATGSTAPDTLQFTAFVSPTYLSFGLLLKGDANAPGGIASSDGVRCADGQLIRFGAHFAGTNGAPQGYWTYPNTVQTNPVSVQTAQTPGQTAYYQFFYRNTAPNFCTSATTNWSNGVQVDWP